MTFVEPEPSPSKGKCPNSWDLVIDDMRQRDEFGTKKYGTHLQPDNGRDALVDAYQEVLDLAVYLRTELYKRYGR